MALVECLLGPATTPVGQENYTFKADQHGRYVCQVDNLRHVEILTGLDSYRKAVEVAALPAAAAGGDDLVAQLQAMSDALDTANGTIEALTSEKNGLEEKLKASEDRVAELEELLTQPTGSPTESDPGNGGDADDLRDLAGLGDAMAEKLATKGITTFDQLAVLAPETMASIDEELGFRGASARNDWVGQAKAILAARDAE